MRPKQQWAETARGGWVVRRFIAPKASVKYPFAHPQVAIVTPPLTPPHRTGKTVGAKSIREEPGKKQAKK